MWNACNLCHMHIQSVWWLWASKISLRRAVISSNLRTIAIFGAFRMPLVREVSAHYPPFMDTKWMCMPSGRVARKVQQRTCNFVSCSDMRAWHFVASNMKSALHTHTLSWERIVDLARCAHSYVHIKYIHIIYFYR